MYVSLKQMIQNFVYNNLHPRIINLSHQQDSIPLSSQKSQAKLINKNLTLMTQKQKSIIVYEWEKNIPTQKDKQRYDAILAKQKKITNGQIIQKINRQTVKADEVIVRQFLSKYSKPQQLNSPASFTQIKSFFDLLKTNYETIQLSYLQTTKQQEQQESNDLKENKFFQANKTNLSKFIKDESEHYKKCIESNTQKVKGTQDETGISAEKVHNFLKNLLYDTKHIKMYQTDQAYFTLPDYQQKVTNLVKKYTVEVKQLPENSFSFDEIYISEEEILQFLTFFLKSSKDIYIIYARTEKVLSKLEKQYLQKIQQNVKNHSKGGNHDAQNKESMQQDPVQLKTIDVTHNLQSKLKVKNQFEQPTKQLPSQAILRRYREKTPNTDEEKPTLRNSLSKSMSKEQKLEKMFPDLFTFACKRRARIHKMTTFDQIQEEAKLMNLEKFINFCNYLQINDLIGRQLLIDEFKLHAINRLNLNVQKFGLLLQKLILKNSQVINKLLSLQKLAFTKKKDKMIKIMKEQHGKSLSSYKYKLQPVNGKDIESIEVELQEKKRQKQIMKKQKEDNLLKKKQGSLLAKYQTILQNKGTRQKITSLQDSNVTLGNVKDDTRQLKYNLNKKRNFSQKFNPQSLISNFDQQDALWDEYESKIWKRDGQKGLLNVKNKQHSRNQSHNQSILEQALSKRIQKGNKVLQKIHSSNLKYYQIV